MLEGQAYVVSGYLAVLAALLILAGALADYYGRRKIFAIGLTGFGITSLLCGLAPTLELLVVFRLLQGAAGALLVPGLARDHHGAVRGPGPGAGVRDLGGGDVGADAVRPADRRRCWSTRVSWRAAFLINVPLVAIALFATIRHMPETQGRGRDGRSSTGSARSSRSIAIGGLAFGAIRGQDKHWQDPLAWVSLAVGAIALVAFPFLMARRPHPLVPLSLFRRRQFATINLSTLLIYGALYTIALHPGPVPAGVARLHGDRGRRSSACRPGSC